MLLQMEDKCHLGKGFSSSHSSLQRGLYEIGLSAVSKAVISYNSANYGHSILSLQCEVRRKCYWGRMSRLERGKADLLCWWHIPRMRISEEGHTRVQHDMSTHRDMCGFANAGSLRVSVFP